jgi:hypothetical protein
MFIEAYNLTSRTKGRKKNLLQIDMEEKKLRRKGWTFENV